MDGARFLGEAVSDAFRTLQHLLLDRGGGSEHRLDPLRIAREELGPGGGRRRVGFGPDRRRHRRLGDLLRATDRAGDEPPRLLRLVIGARAEPGFENMALRLAPEIEDYHFRSTGGMTRRWRIAGTRARTAATSPRSISAKPRRSLAPPMSSKTSPHGPTTRLWP